MAHLWLILTFLAVWFPITGLFSVLCVLAAIVTDEIEWESNRKSAKIVTETGKPASNNNSSVKDYFMLCLRHYASLHNYN